MSVTVIKNYLTEQESDSVLNFLNKTFSAKTGTTDRSIQRYGLTNSYSSNKVSDQIPEALLYLVRKIEDDGYVQDIKHVTVNRYDPGQYIPYHTDNKEAGDFITIISLSSDSVMLFKDSKGKVHPFNVPARSLLQFGDEHRHKMKHSLEPVATVRYSIVFRKH